MVFHQWLRNFTLMVGLRARGDGSWSAELRCADSPRYRAKIADDPAPVPARNVSGSGTTPGQAIQDLVSRVRGKGISINGWVFTVDRELEA